MGVFRDVVEQAGIRVESFKTRMNGMVVSGALL